MEGGKNGRPLIAQISSNQAADLFGSLIVHAACLCATARCGEPCDPAVAATECQRSQATRFVAGPCARRSLRGTAR